MKILILGAGLMGVCSAYFLRKEGFEKGIYFSELFRSGK